ncbi:MAG: Gfo/Idh/MocA family oxidoreductase [Gammaproteobacteria bacterium]|nr:Gfo/Idh/MocA family oxidoreductase [Gammaproteobacteria bacterium]
MNSTGRRLRAGIVGGGRGAFIGTVHRIAAELDGEASVVAGAMSADPANARASAAAWHLERSYDSFEAMAREEAGRPDGIDFAIVATPNHMHFPVARAFLAAGIHVICDKPLAFSLPEAEQFAALVHKSGPLFALTHNYTGYPLVRHARQLVRDGTLGELRKVLVEYNQDWLMTRLELEGNKQAAWRTDPKRAGISCCVGDIGTHAANLLEFIADRPIRAVCADLTAFVPGRELDDDANMLLRLEGGAKGTLVCSQIACGEENALRIRVYGSRGGLEWAQQEPNTLIFKPAGAPWQTLRTAQGYLSEAARAAPRTPAGHPEGYLEAFAVIYRQFIADVRRVQAGQAAHRDYPGAAEGLRGLQLIAAAVRSSARGAVWESLP